MIEDKFRIWMFVFIIYLFIITLLDEIIIDYYPINVFVKYLSNEFLYTLEIPFKNKIIVILISLIIFFIATFIAFIISKLFFSVFLEELPSLLKVFYNSESGQIDYYERILENHQTKK